MARSVRIALLGCLALSALWLLVRPPAVAWAASIVEVPSFGSNPGRLKLLKQAPPGANAPLVVVLHGCQQQARAYASDAGWVQLAEAKGFALLLPEQTASNHPLNCFNWYLPTHTRRDRGEAQSIRQMIEHMQASDGIDARRVFVTGLSAGGAMAAVMLATYPEVFAAGGVIAGLPYGCADTLAEATTCMRTAHPGTASGLWPGTCLWFPLACLPGAGGPGGPITPKQWADFVRAASSHAGPFPRLSIWHGTVDNTVVVPNAAALVAQWTELHGLSQSPSATATVKGHQHQVYKDAAAHIQVELYLLAGMAHGAPIDPGTGAQRCGKAAPYVLDVDICSSLYLTRFWGL